MRNNELFIKKIIRFIFLKNEVFLGCCSVQQPFFIALSASRNSNYPQFNKLRVVPKDDSETTNAFLSQSLVLSKRQNIKHRW